MLIQYKTLFYLFLKKPFWLAPIKHKPKDINVEPINQYLPTFSLKSAQPKIPVAI